MTRKKIFKPHRSSLQRPQNLEEGLPAGVDRPSLGSRVEWAIFTGAPPAGPHPPTPSRRRPASQAPPGRDDPKLSLYAHVRLEPVRPRRAEQEEPKRTVTFHPFAPPQRLRLVVSHGSIALAVASSEESA
ncbi:histone-lysine N-methyltransferase KMT5C [Mauremys reevesii]|uniref:histone-lysine N-methyltransferase KMT5C n=1 Tax=Mauremys reevesii TaxID=260615 RepID=UPI00193FA625|nr:histone-lysine N-methyltransferase KMT5C [Mauremys reevesii]